MHEVVWIALLSVASKLLNWAASRGSGDLLDGVARAKWHVSIFLQLVVFPGVVMLAGPTAFRRVLCGYFIGDLNMRSVPLLVHHLIALFGALMLSERDLPAFSVSTCALEVGSATYCVWRLYEDISPLLRSRLYSIYALTVTASHAATLAVARWTGMFGREPTLSLLLCVLILGRQREVWRQGRRLLEKASECAE